MSKGSKRSSQLGDHGAMLPFPVMLIRSVRPDEFAAAGELVAAVYSALIPDIGDYVDELRDVATRIASGAEVWVAELDGEIAATVTYVPRPGPFAEWSDPAAAGIRMLAVAPAFQRRGIGEALVRACLDRARADGQQRVYLHTTQWMTDAQRLYLRMGFERAPDLDWEPAPEIHLAAYRFVIARGF